MEDLLIANDMVIPAGELHWTFSPSGGPGGQHANRASSRAQLRFDIAASVAFDAPTKERLLTRLGPRVKDGTVTVGADASRSQWQNRQAARKRLVAILQEALRPEPVRVSTKPSRAAKRRRLDSKRKRSETKRLRGRPDLEA
jgi:ribosome-associated protein